MNTRSNSVSEEGTCEKESRVTPDEEQACDEEQASQSQEALSTTIKAALPVFRQQFPEFTGEEAEQALQECFRAEVSICRLVESAFAYLIQTKLISDEPRENRHLPSEGDNDDSDVIAEDEDDAFHEETRQIRLALHQSHLDQAVTCSGQSKSRSLWTEQDFVEEFRDSIILKALSEKRMLTVLCSRETCELAFKLLQNERNCQKWYRTEKGLYGYLQNIAQTTFTACRVLSQVLQTPYQQKNETECAEAATHIRRETCSPQSSRPRPPSCKKSLKRPRLPTAACSDETGSSFTGKAGLRRSVRVRKRIRGHGSTCSSEQVPNGEPTSGEATLRETRIMAGNKVGTSVTTSSTSVGGSSVQQEQSGCMDNKKTGDVQVTCLQKVLASLVKKFDDEIIAVSHLSSQERLAAFFQFRPKVDTAEDFEVLEKKPTGGQSEAIEID